MVPDVDTDLKKNWSDLGNEEEEERRKDKGRLGRKESTLVPFHLLF